MTLDTKFAAGMRQQLVDTAGGISPLAQHMRRRRLAVGLVAGGVAVALLTAGGVAIAGIPGQRIVLSSGPTVTEHHVGSATVELALETGDANAVQVTITCTSAGSFVVEHGMDSGGATGTEWECGNENPIGRSTPLGELPLVDGAVSLTVTTEPNTTWTIDLHFVTSELTEWGVNANGQTFGTSNNNGNPDLIAVQATNGAIGYSYWSDFMIYGNEGNTFPVYESDGTTVIGEFYIGDR